MFIRWSVFFFTVVTTVVYASGLTEEEFEQLRRQVNQSSSQGPSFAITTTNELLQAHRDSLSLQQRIRLLYGKAWFLIQTDNLEEAIETLAECKQLSTQVPDRTILFSYYSLTASAFSRMNMYEKALENWLQSYEIAGWMETTQFLRQTENNIGYEYLKMGRYADAKRYFNRFYEDAKERNLPSPMGVGLNNLGETAFEMGDYQTALDYHHKSLAIREQHNYKFHSSWSHHNLGRTYMALGDNEKARMHLQKAIDIRNESDAKADSIAPQIDLIKLTMQTDKPMTVVAKLEQVVALAKTHGRSTEQAQALQLLSEYFNQTQQWERALQATQQYMHSKFELMEKQAATGVALYAAQLNLATKERDIAQLTQDNRLHQANTQAVRTQLTLVVVAALLIALLTTYFVSRIRAKNRLLTATLENLKTTQKQLLESEKMSAMTTLVSGMAHQLNTPLGLVVTSASCLEDKLAQIQSKLNDQTLSGSQLRAFLDEAAEMLAMTARNSAKAADLIARFKMISASLDASEAARFEIKDYLQKKCPLLMQNMPMTAGLNLTGESVVIFSYPEVLLKVMYQLIENSFAHGFAVQPNPKISVDIRQDGELVEIAYRDNGSGIHGEEHSQIFDPFYTSQMGKGKLGLGLNIVYNSVVHILKGEVVCIESADGACFKIRIPLDVKSAQ